MEEGNWHVGDVWQTRHSHLFRVVEVRPDGMAMLKMFHPYKTRPLSQKLIPSDWIKLPQAEQAW